MTTQTAARPELDILALQCSREALLVLAELNEVGAISADGAEMPADALDREIDADRESHSIGERVLSGNYEGDGAGLKPVSTFTLRLVFREWFNRRDYRRVVEALRNRVGPLSEIDKYAARRLFLFAERLALRFPAPGYTPETAEDGTFTDDPLAAAALALGLDAEAVCERAAMLEFEEGYHARHAGDMALVAAAREAGYDVDGVGGKDE